MPSDLRTTLRDALNSGLKLLRQFAYTRPGRQGPSRALGRRPRVGLALGGGFARGLAHIGVLKVLQESRIQIDALAGTSVGSVVAAAFASGAELEGMMEEARRIRFKNVARWTVARLGLATNERLSDMLSRILRCATFEELNIPLAVVTADIVTGETVVFRSGELITPLRASCSFPGLFTPIEYQGHLLVDGAIVGSVPVSALDGFQSDICVAVNLKSDSHRHVPRNMFQIIGQAFQIAQNLNDVTWRDRCDVIIEPEVSEIKWDGFEHADELMFAGEAAARRALPALLARLEARPAVVSSGGAR